MVTFNQLHMLRLCAAVAALSSLNASDLWSCDCGSQKPWVLGRVEYFSTVLDVTVLTEAKQVGWEYPTVELKVGEVLKGDNVRAIVRVRGDRGGDCLGSVAPLVKGTRWVVAVERASGSTDAALYETPCGDGGYFAEVRNDIVSGLLTKEDYMPHRDSEMSLAAFREYVMQFVRDTKPAPSKRLNPIGTSRP